MNSRWILGLSRVQPGDWVEVWDRRSLRHVGAVSQVAPRLGVLWIVEVNTGIPKMISLQDFRLRYAPVAQAA
jgi:hypothetical protein